MKKIDTSDWSIAYIDFGDHVLEDRTLQSEAYITEFCAKYGYKLVGFKKGTNPLCG